MSQELFRAVAEKNIDLVRALLKNKKLSISASSKDERGNTPLILAAQAGNQDLVKALVKLGASVDDTNKAGNTPLMLAAQTGNSKLVKTLVNLGADVNKQSQLAKYTALILAAQSGHKEVVEFLVAKKAILGLQDINEKSALTWAAQSDQLPVVEFLLKVGAQPLTPDSNGKYPIMFAIDNEATSVIKAILKSVDEYSGSVKGSTPLSRDHATKALLYAAEKGKSKACEVLVQHGANVHFMDDNHQTPLSLAVASNNIKVVEMLLSHGAKPDRADLERSMISHNNTEMFKLLLKHGADPKGDLNIDKLGGFPLMGSIIERVMMHQNAEVLGSLLKDHGFNANERIGHGYSLLAMATSTATYGPKQSEVVNCLLTAGHDLTYQEPQGNTAFLNFIKTYLTSEMFEEIGPEKSAQFHQFMDPTIGAFIRHIKEKGLEAAVLMPAVKHAIESSNLGLIDVMRQEGLNINQQDINGYTPLMYTILENNPKLTQELLQRGADAHLTNKSKENALDLAINNDKAESFMALVSASELKDTAAIQSLCIDVAFTAAKKGKGAILGKLIENSTNLPNFQDKEGYTLLMHAVEKGNIEIVKQIVEQKHINLTLKNHKGDAALKMALDGSSEEIRKIMTSAAMATQKKISKGAQVNAALPQRAQAERLSTAL